MQRNLRFQQQNSFSSNQVQSQYAQRIQLQQQIYQIQGLCLIQCLLYGLMLLILITFIISIVAISQNSEQQQVVFLCILLFLLLAALFGCALYIQQQFSEADINNIKIYNEVQMNNWVYISTSIVLFQYTSQSKFTIFRLTYLYSAFAVFFLVQNIIFKTYYECYDKKSDQHYETSSRDEDDYYDECTRHYKPAKFQGPMLIPLGILCEIVIFIFLGYELIRIIQQIYMIFKTCFWPTYQHDKVNINIPQVIIQTKVFCIIFFINNLGKFIALLVILTLTPNNLSYVLISSNLFYHFIMAIFILSLLCYITSSNNYQQDTNILFVDYQILIDSILQRNNNQNRVFKLFLTVSFIFTIVGISMFDNQMDTSNVIINYDIFVEYDCGITQLILLGLMLLRYIIIPFCIDRDQIVQIQPVGHQQIVLQQLQPQYGIPINNVQNNLPQQARLVPISNLNKNFIFKVELNEKTDCTICLQQLIQNSQENPVVQLKCHISHIFHQKCIQDWLSQIKKCPICNTEFS